MDEPGRALPQRRRPTRRAVSFDGNRSPILYVTVCSKDRKQILADDVKHQVLLEAWSETPSYAVGRYVILPDHIHLFCALRDYQAVGISRWMHTWKAHAIRNAKIQGRRPLWQRSFWDRQLRNGESYDRKWEYTTANPVRHGLVKSSTEWRFQGEIHKLEWHD